MVFRPGPTPRTVVASNQSFLTGGCKVLFQERGPGLSALPFYHATTCKIAGLHLRGSINLAHAKRTPRRVGTFWSRQKLRDTITRERRLLRTSSHQTIYPIGLFVFCAAPWW